VDEQTIRRQMVKYTFYHTVRLTDTLQTPGWEAITPVVGKTLEALRTLDLRGKRVLDFGCRDGLCCFEAEKLGAAEVIGIDNDLSRGAVEFLIPFFQSRVRMVELNVYDLTPQHFGTFDVIVFSGVLYHLRYPFWGLRRLKDVLRDGGALVLETATLEDDNRHALLYCPVGDESPYEPTSCTFFNLKGLRDSLHSLGLEVQSVSSLCQYPPVNTLDRAVPLIERSTLVCTPRPRAQESQGYPVSYWEGTHTINSTMSYRASPAGREAAA
jgi:SAM-dependent methyltransferase